MICQTSISKKCAQLWCRFVYSLTVTNKCIFFKGIGNIWPIKLLLTNKAFQDALSKLGDSWEVSAEEFTTTMNGRSMYKSVNAARLGKSAQGKVWWHRWSQKALQQHIRRTNYQICIWKAVGIPRPGAPSVADGHDWTAVNGQIQPLWFNGPLIVVRWFLHA